MPTWDDVRAVRPALPGVVEETDELLELLEEARLERAPKRVVAAREAQPA